MERWQNKVAVVTGASSGIGAAVCKTLVENGMIVVGLARRLVKMNSSVANTLAEDKKQNFHAFKCDVGDEQSVKDAFSWIEDTFGGVDVLINNAGVMKTTSLLAENNTEDLVATMNTNVMGVVWCTREAFRSMRQRDGAMGHVIIVNSVAGHKVPFFPGINFNIYPSSKHAVTAMTEVLSQELANEKTKIKITSLSPGGVHTEILNHDVPEGFPILMPEDISNAVLFCLQTPPHVQIKELTIRPVGEML
ncbi:farnesol dehydrogenase-like [Musca autumnalis]|uniref:farnesol dehydrogenase-like n=1 Tax=Musca autumnalis TaxID=221902 RepID=UPI003CF016F6